MAKVTVKLFGVYRMDTRLKQVEVEAAVLSEALEKLHAIIEEKAKAEGNMEAVKNLSFKDATVFIGGERVRKKKHKLSDGDEIWVLSPASGG